MIHTLRSVVAGIDPHLALDPVQPMAHAISAEEAPRRFNTGLITAFAMAALLLAAMGIYAVIAFDVSERTQEIAVRIALGARRGNIARLVLGSGARIAAAGCSLVLLGSLAVSRLVGTFLIGVSATNPLIYAAASVSCCPCRFLPRRFRLCVPPPPILPMLCAPNSLPVIRAAKPFHPPSPAATDQLNRSFKEHIIANALFQAPQFWKRGLPRCRQLILQCERLRQAQPDLPDLRLVSSRLCHPTRLIRRR